MEAASREMEFTCWAHISFIFMDEAPLASVLMMFIFAEEILTLLTPSVNMFTISLSHVRDVDGRGSGGVYVEHRSYVNCTDGGEIACIV